MLVHFRSLGLLALLALLFFLPLVFHPTQVLYSDHSDLVAEHIPARRFLIRSWQETGEVPLWCPYLFSGAPFIHDIQVAVFYPLHLPLFLLPARHIGAALSWLIVLHVLIAGWSMMAYACHRGLTPLPAFVAAAGYMFGGRWLMHLLGGGHTILIGLAWLPLVLLCLENAIRCRGLLWGLGASVAYALVTLGTQPQWTFYAGLFAALWTLGVALEEADRRNALLRWLGFGAATVVLAASLAAVQLLPTLEAAGQSSRAAGVRGEGILEGGVRVLLFLVGPALSVEPANLMWEDRGGLALLWLCAAVLAPVLRRGVRYQAGVCAALVVFSMGGAWLVQALPGFNLFRQPARMMVIATFPIAYLAGVTTQALAAGLDEGDRRRCRRWLLRLGAATLLLCGGFALRLLLQNEPLRLHPYWIALPVAFGLAFWLLRGGTVGRPALLWAVLLLVDLFALSAPLVAVRPEEQLYALPECVRFVAADPSRGRVLDRDREKDGKPVGAPLGRGAPLALEAKVEAVRGYSPLDTLRYREYLQFIAGDDRPLRALDSAFTYPVIDNFAVVNRSLFDLLGVRYLLQPGRTMPKGEKWRALNRDENPVVYDFVTGGFQELGPYTVFENESAFPRAFVVPRARPLPDRGRVLRALTTTNFKETVLLEDFDPVGEGGPFVRGNHTVHIRNYQPNRVELEVSGDAAGYLVLADIWYPGWTCTVNGRPAKSYRANYLFRAVVVPSGDVEVVFRFEPGSFRVGKVVSLAALVLMALVAFVGARRLTVPRGNNGRRGLPNP